MVESGHHPTPYTYGGLLKALCKAGKFEMAFRFFYSILRIPYAVDVVLFNTLLVEICKLGNFVMETDIVVPDLYTYTILFSGLCRKGKVVTAILLLGRALKGGSSLINQDASALQATDTCCDRLAYSAYQKSTTYNRRDC